MTTEKLNCNHCGATFEVPTTARFVTCNQCGAQLSVLRSGGVSYTEASSGPALRDMADRLDEITRQNELARIDREWQIERDQYMRYGRYGSRYRPTVGMSIITGVIGLVGGGLWTLFTLSIVPQVGGFGLLFPLFGVFFMAVGVGTAIYNYNLAQRYDEAYAAYQQRRQRLLHDGQAPPPHDEDRERPETFYPSEPRP
jgi:hypothetical protein